jgi:ABC-2 type transport system ATP-binding protein
MEEKIIDVKDLVKKFGDFTAVNNISFDVKKGEIFAFLGPNGAGKTTTKKFLQLFLITLLGILKLMVSLLFPKKIK